MRVFKENPRYIPLDEIDDDELISKITQVMWSISKIQDKNRLLPELERFHSETIRRGKPHLYLRAKDCFRANLAEG